MSRESSKQENINPTMLESNNETKPTESIKRDSIQETSINTESSKLESKKPNDTKNKDNIKLDSNGDEIVWELEKKINIFNALWSWGILIIVLLAMLFVFTLLPLKYSLGFATFLIFVIGVLAIIGIFCDFFYKTLNIKKIYATKDYLVIERLFNKNIMIPLGSFYIRLTGEPSPIILDSVGCFSFVSIINFQQQKELYNFILPSINPLKSTNFNLLEQIMIPKIELYLANIGQDDYEKISIQEHPEIIGSKIDFDRIDKMRKGKGNGK